MNAAIGNPLHLPFLTAVFAVSITGFWNIYFGPGATPTAYHHLHVITTLAWLLLLGLQLILIRGNQRALHRRIGLSLFIVGPFLIGSLALLSVHSAGRALSRDEADPLVVQNIFPAIEVGLFLVFGFLVRKNRKLHGNFLLSSALLFMGIALFFTLISFVPGFIVTGPDTFDRFEKAAVTATGVCAAIGLVLYLSDRKAGWPWLLATGLFFINALISVLITEADKTKWLTDRVGVLNELAAFVGAFVIFLAALVAAWRRADRSG